MRLTKSTSHAIRILIDCARGGDDLIKVATLSQRLEITPQNTFKIVNLLARAGLIEAVRGRNGGVKLARPAHAIRIGDVVRATEVTRVEIEGEVAPGARRRSRGVNHVLGSALEAFIEVLDRHTIADMVKTYSSTSLPRRRKHNMRTRTPSFAGRSRRALHGG